MQKLIALCLLAFTSTVHAVDRTTCPQERVAAFGADAREADFHTKLINSPGASLKEIRQMNALAGKPVNMYIVCLVDARLDELQIGAGGVQPKTSPTPRQMQESSAAGRSNNSNNMANSRPHSETDSTPEPSDSQPAMNCVVVSRPEGDNWASMYNKCSFYITVEWCYVGAECGTSGGGNLGNIAPRQTRKASTFISEARKYELRYSACSGRDKTIVRDGPQRYFCK